MRLAVIALENECRRLFTFQIGYQFSLSKLEFSSSPTKKAIDQVMGPET
jgi:hypothetical protein